MGRRSESEADLAVATVVEVAASHSVYVSQPAAVADLIKQATSSLAAPGVIAAPAVAPQMTPRASAFVLPAAVRVAGPGRFSEW